MNQVNIFVIYRLSEALERCRQEVDPVRWAAAADDAVSAISSLIRDEAPLKLKGSFQEGQELLLRVFHLRRGLTNENQVVHGLDDATRQDLHLRVAKFRDLLEFDLSRSPTFFVADKGVYDTKRLINGGDIVLGSIRSYTPQKVRDDISAASMPTRRHDDRVRDRSLASHTGIRR